MDRHDSRSADVRREEVDRVENVDVISTRDPPQLQKAPQTVPRHNALLFRKKNVARDARLLLHGADQPEVVSPPKAFEELSDVGLIPSLTAT